MLNEQFSKYDYTICAELKINKKLSKAKMLRINQKSKRLSYKEHMVDALALGAEEGRDKLRKATGSCK